MKFIINTTNLQSGGALQVASSLLNEWNKHCVQHEFHVCLSPQLADRCRGIKFNQHIRLYPFKQHSSKGLFHLLRNRQQLQQIESHIQADAVLTVFGPGIWTSKAPQLVGFANGYYLFDDSYYIKTKLGSDVWNRIYYYGRRWLLLQQLKKEALYFWVETPNAQKRLSAAINVPSSNIQVIGNCANINTSTTSSQQNNNNKTFRLLYLSAYYEHKNFGIIPKVITALEKRKIQCQFCVTLPDKDFKQIFGHNNNTQYLLNLGPIASSATSQTYANADAVFMPSLLETFSANYPEAMLMNKPLLCSDMDFARAICGKAALYFNPFDADDVADKICMLMQDKALQAQLIAAGQQIVSEMETPKSRAEKLVQQLIHIATPPVKTNTSCVA